MLCISDCPCRCQSSICIPKAESFGSHLHMTVTLVLRIKQHVDGLAQSIKLINSQVQVPNDRDVSFYAYRVNSFSNNTGN